MSGFCIVSKIVCGDQFWINKLFHTDSIHVGYKFNWFETNKLCEIVEIIMGEEKYSSRGKRIVEEIVLEIIE